MEKHPVVSVIMPCLNEEKTVGLCVQKARESFKRMKVSGEVIISDNGSTDNSVKMARKAGAKVVIERIKGYGSAYLAGFKEASGDFLIMGDSDGTYDFSEIPKLISPLKKGFDMVVGSRLKGQIQKGAMPVLNRYFGTPTINFFLSIFYKINVSDSQSGMRAMKKEAYQRLKLKTLGMEFASEMIVRAAQEKLKMTEVPIKYFPRIAPTKLSRFKDAWRHLRFLLLFAPTYLFLIPGSVFLVLGLIGLILILPGPFYFLGHGFDINSMIVSSMLALVGYQIIMLGVFSKAYSWTQGFSTGGLILKTTLKHFQLEKGIFLGGTIFFIGIITGLYSFINWAKEGFGPLLAFRPTIFSMTLVVLGIQVVFSSFFLSILGIEKLPRKLN